MSTSDTPTAGDRPEPSSEPPVLEVRLAVYDDAPDECTLAPRDAEGVELMSRWITAAEGSFVAVEEMR